MALIHLLMALAWPAIQAAPPDTAVLRIGTRAIVVFRAPLGSPTTEARAAAAARRVQAALAAGRDSIAVLTGQAGVVFLLGGQPVFMVTPADADTAAGASLSEVGDAALAELRLAVREAEESHNLRALLSDVVKFLAATALLLIFIRFLRVGGRRLSARLEPLWVAVARRLGVHGVTVIQPSQIAAVGRALVAVAGWLLGLTAGYAYLTFALNLFPWTRPWGGALGDVLLHSLGQLALAGLQDVPGLVVLVLIFFVTRFVTSVLRTVLDAVGQGRLVVPWIHPETAEPTRRIVVALLWMFAIVVAYPYVPGSGSTAFKGVSVITGVLVTFGSAGLVGQAMSGLVLMYSRSFRVGDYIQAAGVQGTVVELGLLSTRLRTPKNEFVTVPNNVVVSGTVTDYSAGSRHNCALLIYSSVTIGYDTPWRRVHELLIAAASQTEGVLKDPGPFVLQKALDDSYVEYQLNAAIDPARSAELVWIHGHLHASIQDTFWQAGVEIMSPSYHAVRDGNTVTIPPEHRPKQRTAAFRVDVNPSD
jgi:small-conductance mechanosensitive channel